MVVFKIGGQGKTNLFMYKHLNLYFLIFYPTKKQKKKQKHNNTTQHELKTQLCFFLFFLFLNSIILNQETHLVGWKCKSRTRERESEDLNITEDQKTV